MSQSLRRVAGLLLVAVLLASTAPAQTFNKLYFKGTLPNELTSVIRTSDGGYLATANFPEGAALVKLQASGNLQWSRHYGAPTLSLRAVMVRQEGHLFAWTGYEVGAVQTTPLLAVTDLNGHMQWARRIALDMNAEPKVLEIDPIGKGFWVGGTGWPGPGQVVPWIARFGPKGNALWVRSFHFAQPCQLNSLVPTGDGGAIGVGQVMVDIQGSLKQRMFAFKVDSAGQFAWAFRYDGQKVDLSVSQQWLVDISRSGSVLYVAGVITGLCSDPLSSPCVPRPRSILAATIDEVSGDLKKVWAIYDKDGRSLWAYTVAGAPDRMAIGGRVDVDPADSEALLLSVVLEDHHVSLLQGKLYGDGAGPFTSQVEDVAWAGGFAPNDQGFVLVTRQRHNLWRPAIIRTDQSLSADPTHQTCEYRVLLNPASVSTTPSKLKPHLKDHQLSRLKIPESPTEPAIMPCTQLLP